MSNTVYRSLAAFILLISVAAATPAFALVDIAVGYGISNATQNVSNISPAAGLTTSAGSYTSYGALVNFILPGMWSVGTGVLYTEMGSHYKITGLNSDYDEKAPYIQIPITLNYWLGHIVGIGVGGYYGFPGGNISDKGTLLGVPNLSSSGSFSQQNYASSDYGLVGQVQIHIPLGVKWFILADGMYEYGLQNVDNSPTANGTTIKNTAIVAVGGLGLVF
jgi:hypothetical protein